MLNEISGFGSPFSHDLSSCCNRVPTNFKWVFGQPSKNNIEVYMDYNILGGVESSSNNKFLWLCESKELFIPQYKFIEENVIPLKNIYKKIFTHDFELLKISDLFEYCPSASNKSWIMDGKIYNKTKIASMICSGKDMTTGHKNRNNLMKLYKEQKLEIDFYGRNHNPFKEKEQALSDYCFSFVVENGQYSNYYTEKIMDCFATGTIPIYWGSPEINKEFNMDGIIILDNLFDYNTLSFDLYNSKIGAIQDNFNRQNNHKIADDILFEKIQKYL